MTREEFIRRWRHKLAGMALFGAVSEVRDGPLVRATKIMDLPAEVEKILGAMWDDLSKDVKPVENGKVIQPVRK